MTSYSLVWFVGPPGALTPTSATVDLSGVGVMNFTDNPGVQDIDSLLVRHALPET